MGKGETTMGVELVNRSFVRELFNVPERRAKIPMSLGQHKAVYQELVTTNPRDGSMRTIAEYFAGAEIHLLPHYIQSERDIRRLALHRVEEAIDDLGKQELKEFVVYLVEQSKRRQEDDEEKLNTLIGYTRKLSKDEEWFKNLAQVNRLRLIFADASEMGEGVRVGCWFCENRVIPIFDPFMFKMWVIRQLKRWLGIRHR